MHKAEGPLEYFMATTLDISARSGPSKREKDLQLCLPWPRQRTRWVEVEGGWNDTSSSGSLLASFSLPSCQKKKKLSETVWVPRTELTNSFRSFKTTFLCKFTLPPRISPASPSLLVLFSDWLCCVERPAISPLLTLLSLLFVGSNFLPL